jgi:hypothetical protein
VCSITAMMGSIFSAIIQVLMEGKLTAGTGDNITWIIGEIVLVVHTSIYHSEFSVGDVTDAMEEDRLKLLILQGGVVIGLCTTFQVSSIGRKGPVLVSMFSPFQTVFSAFISLIFFGQWIGLGW